MKKLLSTLMGLAAFNVLADVIVYDNHLTYTTTGAGSVSRLLDSGWTILDVQTGASTQLSLIKSRGVFQVLALISEAHHVAGALGKSIVVVYVQPSSGASGLGTATGVATPVNAGTQSYTAAKTLTVESSYVDSTETYWQTVKGSLTFDSKRTVTQNQIDGNYTNTVQRLTQLLLSEGYTQAQ